MPRTPNSTPLTLQEQEKVKVLSASGKTPHAIARELNRSPHTIRRYLSYPEASMQIQEMKQELAGMFEGLAKRMIASITEEDIQKINAYQRTLSAAVSTDKMRVLRGIDSTDESYFMQVRALFQQNIGELLLTVEKKDSQKQTGYSEKTEE